MNKKWKNFGIIILAAAVLLAFFDITVLVMHEIQWNKYISVYKMAENAGYTEDYTICSRQGTIVIDRQEYLCFNAHRHAILDGDYNENLLVSKNDQFEDMFPYEEENLQIFAKKIERVTGNDGQYYTLIDVYRIDKYREGPSHVWFFRALVITIVLMPIVFISVIIWVIHFFIYKAKRRKLKENYRN